jgi:hypothetical protein
LTSSFRSSLAWLAFYLVLAFVLLQPLSLDPASRLPDDGDAVLGLWIIWWGATHLSWGYPGIFDANAFYPHPSGLLYSEAMLGQAILSWPLFSWLNDPLMAMNLLTLLSLGLSGLASHLLFRELTGSPRGAVTGAVFFTFNGYSFSQLARIQLISLQWMPLGLLCLHRYFAKGRKAHLFGFALFSILQGLSCVYYLLFYLVALAVLLPVYLRAYRGFANPRSVAWLAASGLSVGAALAFVALPYLRLYAHYGFAGVPESYDLAAYFLPGSESLLYRGLGVRPVAVDHFLGYVGLVIAAVGAAAFLRDAARREAKTIAIGYLLVGLAAFFLSAGPELRFLGRSLGDGPFSLLSAGGPFRNMRVPDRFSVLVTLALGLFISRGAGAILGRARLVGAKSVLLASVLTALVLAEHWSPARTVGREIPGRGAIPDVYRWLGKHQAGEIVAELPARPFREMRFVTMDGYFSMFHGRKILFNKPSFYPPAMGFLQWELQSFPSRSSLTLLQAIDVPLAIVHPKRWGEGILGRARLRAIERRLPELTLLGEFPDRDDPLWARFQLGAERLYSIPPLPEEGSPRVCSCREIPRDSFEVDANGLNHPRRALDGNRTTKWTTGDTQKKGHFFEIAFDSPRRPVRIEMEMVYPYGEFPRHLEVNGYSGLAGRRMEQLEDVWYKVALVRQLVHAPAEARFRIDLEPATVDRLRMFIHVTEEGGEPWSIAEIHVYELADGEDHTWGEGESEVDLR